MIKIAVIGLGIGASHARAIARSNKATLAALCDTNPAKLDAIAQELSCDTVTTDYKTLLSDPEIDAVVVATPDDLHEEMVCEAFRAGKHVLCEKPLALNYDACRRMIEASEKHDRRLMVGQVCRVAPGFVAAKRIIDEGMLGELYFIESEYAHDYTDIRGWRTDPEMKRHPVTGGGCHAVDLVRWLAGEEPIEAFSYSNKTVLRDWPCDDSTIAVMKFNSDLMAKVFVSTGCKRAYTMRTVIYGTKGTVIADNTSTHISLFVETFEGADRLLGKKMEAIEHRIPVKVESHNIESEISAFCDCVASDSEPSITAEEGARTVAVCEAIIRSSESGNPEQIKF